MSFQKVDIKRIIGPTPNGAAILLGNEEKTFVIFIGFYEAAALIREINNETTPRPLTHELIQNIYMGFGITVKHVVISSIIDNTFCATLVLQQDVDQEDTEEDSDAQRNEVRIDARPSDCLVLALKSKVDILVSDEVFSQVQDVTQMAQEVENNLAAMLGVPGSEGGSTGIFGPGTPEIPDELPDDIFPDDSFPESSLDLGDFTIEDEKEENEPDNEDPGG